MRASERTPSNANWRNRTSFHLSFVLSPFLPCSYSLYTHTIFSKRSWNVIKRLFVLLLYIELGFGDSFISIFIMSKAVCTHQYVKGARPNSYWIRAVAKYRWQLQQNTKSHRNYSACPEMEHSPLYISLLSLHKINSANVLRTNGVFKATKINQNVSIPFSYDSTCKF